jgi:hypothetical protein
MPQIDSPRTTPVATGSPSIEGGSTAIASAPRGDYRVTFGCSLDAPQGTADVRESTAPAR